MAACADPAPTKYMLAMRPDTQSGIWQTRQQESTPPRGATMRAPRSNGEATPAVAQCPAWQLPALSPHLVVHGEGDGHGGDLGRIASVLRGQHGGPGGAHGPPGGRTGSTQGRGAAGRGAAQGARCGRQRRQGGADRGGAHGWAAVEAALNTSCARLAAAASQRGSVRMTQGSVMQWRRTRGGIECPADRTAQHA